MMALSAVTLALLWVRRRSVLDLWLMVVCCAWLLELTIAATLISYSFQSWLVCRPILRAHRRNGGFARTAFRNDGTLCTPCPFNHEAAWRPRGAADCCGRNGGFNRS